VIGLPQKVVLADDLSREAILAGLAAGRSWIAESSAVDLSFTATGGGRSAGIGERLPVDRDTDVTVSIRVSGVPAGTVRLLTDEGRSPTVIRGGTSTGPPAGFGPMAALTNPICLGRTS
jgi:hypothetical protein